MTSPALPMDPGQLDKLAKQLEGLVKRIQAGIDDLAHKVNSFLDSLGPAGHQVRQVLQGIIETVGKVLAELAKHLAYPGNGNVILDFANAWSDEVGGPVSGLAGNKFDAKTHVDENWKGSASEAYTQILTPERLALQAVAKLCRDLQSSLIRIFVGLLTFWVAVGAATGVFLGVLFVSIAGAATGVGAPAALGAVAGAAGTWVSAVGTAATAAYGAAQVERGNISQVLTNNDGFVTNRSGAAVQWPISTAETNPLKDASLKDGDKERHWHLK